MIYDNVLNVIMFRECSYEIRFCLICYFSSFFFPDVRQVGDRFDDLFWQKDGMPSQTYPSAEAFRLWLNLVITFLENMVNIHSGNKQAGFGALEEAADATGAPIRIECEY